MYPVWILITGFYFTGVTGRTDFTDYLKKNSAEFFKTKFEFFEVQIKKESKLSHVYAPRGVLDGPD